MHEITELLHAWNSGDKQAFDRLMPLVDPELKKIARNYMRQERPGNILQTTALVNEALIKVIKEKVKPEDRKQFYGFIARRMRQVLTDYARKEKAGKRGGGLTQVDMTEAEEFSSEKSREIVLLEEALAELTRKDERKVAMIEYRFFIGLSIDETANVMGLSSKTVQRDWDFAQAWLTAYMSPSEK